MSKNRDKNIQADLMFNDEILRLILGAKNIDYNVCVLVAELEGSDPQDVLQELEDRKNNFKGDVV